MSSWIVLKEYIIPYHRYVSLINDIKEVNLIWSPLHENLENFLFTWANAHNKNIKSRLSGPHGQTNTKDDFLTKIAYGF